MSNQQLLDIIKDERKEQIALRNQPLIDCPECGTTLEVRNGLKNCPLGHFRTRAATKGQTT